MSNPHPLLSKTLLLLVLLSHPIAYANNQEPVAEISTLHSQVVQLQSQLQENNNKIAALEIALNTANEDIGMLQNEIKLNLKKISAETTQAKPHRTANGHGR